MTMQIQNDSYIYSNEQRYWKFGDNEFVMQKIRMPHCLRVYLDAMHIKVQPFSDRFVLSTAYATAQLKWQLTKIQVSNKYFVRKHPSWQRNGNLLTNS